LLYQLIQNCILSQLETQVIPVVFPHPSPNTGQHERACASYNTVLARLAVAVLQARAQYVPDQFGLPWDAATASEGLASVFAILVYITSGEASLQSSLKASKWGDPQVTKHRQDSGFHLSSQLSSGLFHCDLHCILAAVIFIFEK
jgi:hypothetical protein